jgi:dipeptidyl aminopeptidase/acylaminoacyl peptidase
MACDAPRFEVCSRVARSRWSHRVVFLVLVISMPTAWANGTGDRRPVSVADAIAMTNFSDQRYFLGDSSDGRVAQFSPDGKWFSIVLEKGDIEHNTNVYSLLLFETERAFGAPKPVVLLTLSSYSGHAAIMAPKWLQDNETLIFLCEENEKASQVCALNRMDRRLERRTHHETRVLSFDASSDGRAIVFLAEPPARLEQNVTSKQGVIVAAPTPDSVPRDDCSCPQRDPAEANRLFVQVGDGPERRVDFSDFVFSFQSISLSPDGNYVIVPAAVTNIPEEWRGYTDPLIERYVAEKRSAGTYSYLVRYLLFEIATLKMGPLINAPLAPTSQGIVWAPDSRSVVVSGAYLPLSTPDTTERSLREKNSFVVEVDVTSGNLTKITDRDLQVTKWLWSTNQIVLRSPADSTGASVAFQKTGGAWKEIAASRSDEHADSPLVVTLDEDLNTPPDIHVSEPSGQRRALLLALNPQFASLDFGSAERVTWKATDGHEVTGVLFLPSHNRAGVKYPLVLQTHGIDSERFEIDGPWHSGFAARMLAGRDIVVLEVGHAKDRQAEHPYFNSPDEAPREMAAYEGAIDYLDRRGLIDRDRIGIFGFSRTVWKVEFTLTHSKYAFAAAMLVDGFDGGYWQYLLYRAADTDYGRVNGGQPFGEGLAQWLSRSPSFHLDRVHTPVRIEEHGFYHVLSGWEWFSALTHLGRPVEMLYLPAAPHLLVKPWDRLASQQGTVDWFCFWLKGEKDTDPAKAEQYQRWEVLQLLQRRGDVVESEK